MRHSRRILFGDETRKLELLSTRIDRLDLPLRGTLLDECFRRVRRDLRRAGIDEMRPNFYLSDEYGTVVGTANIGVGFWDADPLLRELHRDARGGTNSRADILLLLRHECGHAFCYLYKLYRDAEFRRLFRVRGHFFRTYPSTDRYVPNPWSKHFVNPFGDHYAQKHPDDDFADTFAEFLAGGWKRRYRAKPGALKKLRYVERTVRAWGRKPAIVRSDPRDLDQPLNRMKRTVRAFLRARVGRYDPRGFLDPDLSSIFTRRGSAGRFLDRFEGEIVRQAAVWSGAPARVVGDILDKVRERAEARRLGVRDTHRTLVELTAYVSSLATHYATTGRFRN
ncbi:MAG: hypothetical protein HYY17_02775 [Planctomycetes bacterium]|nr:hypothetical protein [Planctomycetota bacterium]